MNIKHISVKDNVLITNQYDNDMYTFLLKLVLDNPCHYSRMLNTQCNRKYIEWINAKTPKLDDTFYKLSTKLYWIFNGLSDFPKCKQCGKILSKRNVVISRDYINFCSIKCVANSSEIHTKKECTCEKKYGKGIKNPSQAPSIKAKKEETSMKHYGVSNPNKVRSVREKIEQTCLRDYGTKSPFESPQVQKKIAQTNLKNIGVANPFELSSTAQKGLEGRIKKYGSAMGKMQTYRYNDVVFDSSWELAVWIYHIDHNIKIERQPIQLKYEMNGSMHTYLPDFRIDGKLVEVKGDQLFDKNGNPIFNNKHPWKEKYQCMIDNNITIWKYKDVKPFLDYVSQKYGKDYLKQFRIQRKKEQKRSEQTSIEECSLL